jgi:uncharacterized membrane protein
MGMFAELLQIGGDSTVYGLVLLLHILSAILGFGGVMFNGLYAQQAQQRPGREGVAINQAVYSVSKVAEIFIYLVFVFGVILVLLADEPISWGDPWIGLSILVYVIAMGVSHGMLFPAVRKANALAEELAVSEGPPPGAQGPPRQVAQLEELGKRIATADIILKVALVTILYLMIWKPGLT